MYAGGDNTLALSGRILTRRVSPSSTAFVPEHDSPVDLRLLQSIRQDSVERRIAGGRTCVAGVR